MKSLWVVSFALLVFSGCNTTGPAPEAAAAPKPELVGPVSSQAGQCFFRDPAGKVFISACPA